MKLSVSSACHEQGIDASTAVRVSVLTVREMEMNLSGRVYAAAQKRLSCGTEGGIHD